MLLLTTLLSINYTLVQPKDLIALGNVEHLIWQSLLYFDSVLLLAAIPYVMRNWYIALSGKTILEESKGLFIPRDTKKDEEENIYDPDDMLELHYDKLAQFLKVHRL